MQLKTIYEDENLQVLDKPAGVIADDFPLRVHRLDKDTSGVFLVAKNEKALKFSQQQFRERKVEKKYLALVVGNFKNSEGRIETLIGRSPKDRRKQKIYLSGEPGSAGKRDAVIEYQVLENFGNFSLIEARPKTGRKHQIRAHLAYLNHPIVGDKLYGFKRQVLPEGLNRQFLHASFLKIQMPDGNIKEFNSELPLDLKEALNKLKIKDF